MRDDQYEVVYIDKFTDSAKAEFARTNLQKTFGLSARHLEKLASGAPVVVKRQVALAVAERYRQAILKAGGTAWVQTVGVNGEHVERRCEKRRQTRDRRTVFRGSSIIPDRRENCGRRSADDPLKH